MSLESRSSSWASGDGALGGSGRLADRLTAWATESRADEAIRRRGLERSLRRQARDEASLAGVALDLAEHTARVVVHTRAGRQYRGTIGVVATEFLVITADTGQDVVVRLRAVASIQPGPGAQTVDGDRRIRLDSTFDEVLRLIVEDRPRVIAVTGIAEPATGVLESVGTDVAEVRRDVDGRQVTYISLPSIDELLIDGRV